MAGVGRSTAATVAPQRSSGPSGPISAPAPSTATVRPSSRSHSGCAATSRTAAAAVGSMHTGPLPRVELRVEVRAGQASPAVRQHELGQRLAARRAPRRCRESAGRARPPARPVGRSAPSAATTTRRRTASSPASAIACHASGCAARPRPGAGSAAGTDCARQSRAPPRRRPPGPTARRASATAARATVVVLRPPVSSAGKETPWVVTLLGSPRQRALHERSESARGVVG